MRATILIGARDRDTHVVGGVFRRGAKQDPSELGGTLKAYSDQRHPARKKETVDMAKWLLDFKCLLQHQYVKLLDQAFALEA